ncbi:methyltransferase-like protein 27 [Diadema setosum]|uniref:methyltransferase-like protein 27 n=1 Tax=Diadema setosum TaxID=31175 RepID=UPI003B3A556F
MSSVVVNNNESDFAKDGKGDAYVDVARNRIDALRSVNRDNAEKIYDEVAREYDSIVEAIYYNGPVLTTNAIRGIELSKDAAILDIGCGTGLVGVEMGKHGYTNMYGLDLSDESLKVAAEKGVYSQTVQANFDGNCRLDFPDGYFDVVTSTGCFVPGHLNGDSVPEMIRLTKPGGHLVLTIREKCFEEGRGGVNLKSTLIDLVQEGKISKVRHERGLYSIDNTEGGSECQGLGLVYRVL